jgi:uncharacterized protein (TIGR02145 family)
MKKYLSLIAAFFMVAALVSCDKDDDTAEILDFKTTYPTANEKLTDSNIKFKWEKAICEDYIVTYDVVINENDELFFKATTADTEKTITLKHGKTYSWYVVAKVADGTTKKTAESTFSVEKAPNKLPVLGNIISPVDGATGIENKNVLFEWEEGDDEDGEELTYIVDFIDSDDMDTETTNLKLTVNLEANTSYKWRLGVTDGRDTVWSEELSFITAGSFSIGTFTDERDGNVYKTITLPTGETFLAENYRYLPFVNKIEDRSGSEARCYVYGYDGNDVNEAKATEKYGTYGVYYNWEAVETLEVPEGWHVATPEEWDALSLYSGMTEEEIALEEVPEKGNVLKSTTGWEEDTNGTDDFGFNILAAGAYDVDYVKDADGNYIQHPDGSFAEAASFVAQGVYAVFYLSTDDYGETKRQYSGDGAVTQYNWYFDAQKGYNIRLVKD